MATGTEQPALLLDGGAPLGMAGGGLATAGATDAGDALPPKSREALSGAGLNLSGAAPRQALQPARAAEPAIQSANAPARPAIAPVLRIAPSAALNLGLGGGKANAPSAPSRQGAMGAPGPGSKRSPIPGVGTGEKTTTAALTGLVHGLTQRLPREGREGRLREEWRSDPHRYAGDVILHAHNPARYFELERADELPSSRWRKLRERRLLEERVRDINVREGERLRMRHARRPLGERAILGLATLTGHEQEIEQALEGIRLRPWYPARAGYRELHRGLRAPQIARVAASFREGPARAMETFSLVQREREDARLRRRVPRLEKLFASWATQSPEVLILFEGITRDWTPSQQEALRLALQSGKRAKIADVYGEIEARNAAARIAAFEASFARFAPEWHGLRPAGVQTPLQDPGLMPSAEVDVEVRRAPLALVRPGEPPQVATTEVREGAGWQDVDLGPLNLGEPDDQDDGGDDDTDADGLEDAGAPGKTPPSKGAPAPGPAPAKVFGGPPPPATTAADGGAHFPAIARGLGGERFRELGERWGDRPWVAYGKLRDDAQAEALGMREARFLDLVRRTGCDPFGTCAVDPAITADLWSDPLLADYTPEQRARVQGALFAGEDSPIEVFRACEAENMYDHKQWAEPAFVTYEGERGRVGWPNPVHFWRGAHEARGVESGEAGDLFGDLGSVFGGGQIDPNKVANVARAATPIVQKGVAFLMGARPGGPPGGAPGAPPPQGPPQAGPPGGAPPPPPASQPPRAPGDAGDAGAPGWRLRWDDAQRSAPKASEAGEVVDLGAFNIGGGRSLMATLEIPDDEPEGATEASEAGEVDESLATPAGPMIDRPIPLYHLSLPAMSEQALANMIQIVPSLRGDPAGVVAEMAGLRGQATDVEGVDATTGEYVVAPGETFESIAKKLVGDPGRARELHAANPKHDPASVRLRLPPTWFSFIHYAVPAGAVGSDTGYGGIGGSNVTVTVPRFEGWRRERDFGFRRPVDVVERIGFGRRPVEVIERLDRRPFEVIDRFDRRPRFGRDWRWRRPRSEWIEVVDWVPNTPLVPWLSMRGGGAEVWDGYAWVPNTRLIAGISIRGGGAEIWDGSGWIPNTDLDDDNSVSSADSSSDAGAPFRWGHGRDYGGYWRGSGGAIGSNRFYTQSRDWNLPSAYLWGYGPPMDRPVDWNGADELMLDAGDPESDHDALEALHHNPAARRVLLEGGFVNGTSLRGLIERGHGYGHRYLRHPVWHRLWRERFFGDASGPKDTGTVATEASGDETSLITIVVNDKEGRPIEDANVVGNGPNRSSFFSSKTGPKGIVTLNVTGREGAYFATVTAPGYIPFAKSFEASKGGNVIVTLELPLAGGIGVTAEGPDAGDAWRAPEGRFGAWDRTKAVPADEAGALVYYRRRAAREPYVLFAAGGGPGVPGRSPRGQPRVLDPNAFYPGQLLININDNSVWRNNGDGIGVGRQRWEMLRPSQLGDPAVANALRGEASVNATEGVKDTGDVWSFPEGRFGGWSRNEATPDPLDTGGVGDVLAAIFTGGLSAIPHAVARVEQGRIAEMRHPLAREWVTRYGDAFWHHPVWRRQWVSRFGVEHWRHPFWRRYGRAAEGVDAGSDAGDPLGDYTALEAFHNNPYLRARLLAGESVNGTTLRGLIARGEAYGPRYWRHPVWHRLWRERYVRDAAGPDASGPTVSSGDAIDLSRVDDDKLREFLSPAQRDAVQAAKAQGKSGWAIVKAASITPMQLHAAIRGDDAGEAGYGGIGGSNAYYRPGRRYWPGRFGWRHLRGRRGFLPYERYGFYGWRPTDVDWVVDDAGFAGAVDNAPQADEAGAPTRARVMYDRAQREGAERVGMRRERALLREEGAERAGMRRELREDAFREGGGHGDGWRERGLRSERWRGREGGFGPGRLAFQSHFYDRPDEDSESMGVMPAGTEVRVVEKAGAFAHVMPTQGGPAGWVPSEHVREHAENPNRPFGAEAREALVALCQDPSDPHACADAIEELCRNPWVLRRLLDGETVEGMTLEDLCDAADETGAVQRKKPAKKSTKKASSRRGQGHPKGRQPGHGSGGGSSGGGGGSSGGGGPDGGGGGDITIGGGGDGLTLNLNTEDKDEDEADEKKGEKKGGKDTGALANLRFGDSGGDADWYQSPDPSKITSAGSRRMDVVSTMAPDHGLWGSLKEELGLDAGAPTRKFVALGGETPQDIARRYDAMARPRWAGELRDANPNYAWSRVYAGDTITIPDAWPQPFWGADSSGPMRVYSASDGDSPVMIAKRYDALSRPFWAVELKNANPGRSWAHTYSGDAINIPDEWPAPFWGKDSSGLYADDVRGFDARGFDAGAADDGWGSGKTLRFYVVQPGDLDNPLKLAGKAGVGITNLGELQSVNPGKDSSNIKVGDRINIPDGWPSRPGMYQTRAAPAAPAKTPAAPSAPPADRTTFEVPMVTVVGQKPGKPAKAEKPGGKLNLGASPAPDAPAKPGAAKPEAPAPARDANPVGEGAKRQNLTANTYEIKAGDTPMKIATRVGIDPKRWSELKAANPHKRTGDLGFATFAVGEIINIPNTWPPRHAAYRTSAPVALTITPTSTLRLPPPVGPQGSPVGPAYPVEVVAMPPTGRRMVPASASVDPGVMKRVQADAAVWANFQPRAASPGNYGRQFPTSQDVTGAMNPRTQQALASFGRWTNASSYGRTLRTAGVPRLREDGLLDPVTMNALDLYAQSMLERGAPPTAADLVGRRRRRGPRVVATEIIAPKLGSDLALRRDVERIRREARLELQGGPPPPPPMPSGRRPPRPTRAGIAVVTTPGGGAAPSPEPEEAVVAPPPENAPSAPEGKSDDGAIPLLLAAASVILGFFG